MFYNTGIATYIWVLTNRKPEHRKGKVQLIDATEWYQPLRKNLGAKNCELGEAEIERICDTFLAFEETEQSKIFDNLAFGYWKVTVERPLRLVGSDPNRVYKTKEIVVFCTVEGYEADDVLGTLSTRASVSGFHTMILTSDLDLLQLVSPITEVEVFSQYWAKRSFDVEAAKRRFGGLAPENIPDYKALAGDTSDNLPGVPGIGAVAATAVLGEYGNLDKAYENLEAIPKLPIRGARRVGRLLAEHREQAFLMRTLTTIVCDVPVDVDIDGAMIKESGLLV